MVGSASRVAMSRDRIFIFGACLAFQRARDHQASEHANS